MLLAGIQSGSFGHYESSATTQVSLPGEHSECEPPDPIPNSEVKPLSADDSLVLTMRK